MIQAGLPQKVKGFTINKVCGSGLKAICLAVNSIIAEDNEILLAGGQENMSLGLHDTYIRGGHKFGDSKMIDLIQYDELIDAFSNNSMGIIAKNIAKIQYYPRNAR